MCVVWGLLDHTTLKGTELLLLMISTLGAENLGLPLVTVLWYNWTWLGVAGSLTGPVVELRD